MYNEVIEKIASPDIKKVVNAINHAVLSSNPKPRYHVGFDAKTLWISIAMLPTKMGDWITSMVSPAILPDVIKMKKKNKYL